jgi:putative DNA primase/helicase
MNTTADEEWAAQVKGWQLTGRWDNVRYGPPPDAIDCLVPQHLLPPHLRRETPAKPNGRAPAEGATTKQNGSAEHRNGAPQPPSKEKYDLDEHGTEVRKVLDRVISSLVAVKSDPLQVLKAVRAGARALAEFDFDPGYDAAIAHLQAVARDHYTLSVDDIQAQISGGVQDALEQRAAQSSGARPHGTGEHDRFDRGKAAARQQPHDAWPDPCPLPEALLPVAPFDFSLLPKKLRPWGVDVAERMQCPADFIGVSIMAALGSVIGRKIVIKPKSQDDWQVVANQWGLIVGRPGILKSPAMEEALKPLKRLCAEAERGFADAQNAHNVDEKIVKIQTTEALRKASKLFSGKSKETTTDAERMQRARELIAENPTSAEPTLRRYIANDTNIASLGVLLQQNPNGLLVFRDEIVSLLSSLDQEERASEKGFYLTGWNGDSSYTFDRIGRGLHLNVECVCLSMLGSTQPGRISDYLSQAVRGGRGDDGLMQRFGLLVWPDISADWKHVDRWPDKVARTTAFDVFDCLDKLKWHAVHAKRDPGSDGDEEGLPYLRFNIDAYDAFVDWRKDLENRLRGDDLHPALESHLAKYRKLVPGLALICHLVDYEAGCETGLVGLPALERAIAWAKYLETHARRAYGSVIAGAAETAKAILLKIKTGHLGSEFSSREVWRPNWSKLTDRTAVQGGLTLLVDYDYLRETKKTATGGRHATVYVVNPKCMKTSL